MPRVIKPKKLPRDINQRAHQVAKLLTGELTESPEPKRSLVSAYLAEIGRTGGLVGGKARAKKLSSTERKRIAKKAAMVKWAARPAEEE